MRNSCRSLRLKQLQEKPGCYSGNSAENIEPKQPKSLGEAAAEPRGGAVMARGALWSRRDQVTANHLPCMTGDSPRSHFAPNCDGRDGDSLASHASINRFANAASRDDATLTCCAHASRMVAMRPARWNQPRFTRSTGDPTDLQTVPPPSEAAPSRVVLPQTTLIRPSVTEKTSISTHGCCI